ncbi:hypothetical protein CDD83_9126 [Cordyceps sp. RAO-2017]|nr:hypothetical protein CDD83_9126 [Cordyceps sp. RAO-2017]
MHVCVCCRIVEAGQREAWTDRPRQACSGRLQVERRPVSDYDLCPPAANLQQPGGVPYRPASRLSTASVRAARPAASAAHAWMDPSSAALQRCWRRRASSWPANKARIARQASRSIARQASRSGLEIRQWCVTGRACVGTEVAHGGRGGEAACIYKVPRIARPPRRALRPRTSRRRAASSDLRATCASGAVPPHALARWAVAPASGTSQTYRPRAGRTAQVSFAHAAAPQVPSATCRTQTRAAVSGAPGRFFFSRRLGTMPSLPAFLYLP